ncbi:DUF4258 domain-containing protein [Anoxynatronum sibiricum]|uniref:DUF4258 domain-containing protein n=1 Tax=Anoxynatronum sibiricum TaxID=210623 RepID=A0ABU9VY68_9CLOT
MKSVAEQFIRHFASKRKFVFRTHAVERMMERGITEEQVYECAETGCVMEEQKSDECSDIKVLFAEPADRPGFYVVIAATNRFPHVVTVCLKDEDVWETVNGFIRRRK